MPLKQGIAVTGSVNQLGFIQPVGGVTEKIEGFYDVCKLRGLTGEQGVLIPEANVRNLVLREEIVEAIREGKFHIYPIKTIDEGISILTGREAGEQDENGQYPEGSVNYLVDMRLRELAEEWKKRGKEEEEEEEQAKEKSDSAENESIESPKDEESGPMMRKE